MTTSNRIGETITPLFVLQFCVILALIFMITLRPGAWNAARLTGLCISVPAAVLLFTARWQLGQSFSITPQARKLVTSGLYSKIRNPIYVFSTLMALGILLALPYRYALLPLAVLIPLQIIRARKEARVLEARFGDEYRKYRERTWV